MDPFYDPEVLAAYAIGQRRGFAVGFLVGAAFVIYTRRYTIARRQASMPNTGTQYYTGAKF